MRPMKSAMPASHRIAGTQVDLISGGFSILTTGACWYSNIGWIGAAAVAGIAMTSKFGETVDTRYFVLAGCLPATHTARPLPNPVNSLAAINSKETKHICHKVLRQTTDFDKNWAAYATANTKVISAAMIPPMCSHDVK